MQLAVTGLGEKYYIFTIFLKKKCCLCIRMGIIISKTFIWGGILSDIRSEIM